MTPGQVIAIAMVVIWLPILIGTLRDLVRVPPAFRLPPPVGPRRAGRGGIAPLTLRYTRGRGERLARR